MNEERFSPYSKRELAAMYFPHTIKEQSAVKNLRRMMLRIPELMKELDAAYYNHRGWGFTSRQVGILFRYLGQP